MTNALIKLGEQAIAPVATSTLSSLVPSVASKVGADVATKAVSRNIPVVASKSLAQAISVGKPEMVDIYRGISAKSDDDLVGYLRQMLDKNVKPTTYSGGSMQGEGYNFSTGRDVAEYFANRRPQQESRAVLHTRVPKDRFIGQNKQNGNRLVDFQIRAESRGIPYENGASARQAEKDMQRYFDRNGLLGIKSPSGETYVINQNDDVWLNNLDVFSASKGRGTRIEPDDSLLSTLRSILPSNKNTQTAVSRIRDNWAGLTDSYANLHEGNSEMNKLWSKEVQLDDDIAKALDKAMGYAKQKMNIPVKMSGDYPDDFSRIPVRFTDKEIDTLHKYTGKIPELYHQTTASSLGDMTLDRRRAVSGDSGMPEGIFLKENGEDIGLLGKHQLALNAKMENPAYFKDRADLDNFMKSRGAKDLMSRRNELDDYYQKLADEAEKKQHELAMIAWDNPTPENKALADQAMNDWQRITEEWTKAIDENGEKAREGIRNTLVNNGYDSAIIENDEGSGGRSVKSYIVFDKNQLSPRYKEGMSFDPNDAQSVFNEASKRQKNLDDVMSKIADKITSAGDKAVYKSGGNKSIESMTNKVARKMASGRDYRLLDMKDHMRGAVFLQDLNNEADEITTLLEEMQYALGQPLDIEAIETDLGYTGLHLTWRDDDGLGYEIQVTTPEIWDTKKASDKIYDEIRNWTESELRADPKKQAVFDAKVAESKKLWSDLWAKLGRRPDLKPIESFNDDMYFY